MTNLLADFSVRFNASLKRHADYFYMPYSNLNIRIIELLLKYNCIASFTVDACRNSRRLRIKITPLYILNAPLVRRIELISKPGHRVYWSAAELASNFARANFQGFYIISTPSGICSSNELIAAKVLEKPISGEILLKINL